VKPNSALAMVICFEPDSTCLDRLATVLREQSAAVLLVDNSESAASRQTVAKLHQPESGIYSLSGNGNRGVAWAMNQAFYWAEAHNLDAVACFDQDSLPPQHLVTELKQILGDAKTPSDVAGVGPVLIDRRSGQTLDSFEPLGRGGRRFRPELGSVYEVEHLINSGRLCSVAAFRRVGPFDEGLFVDTIDLEWSLRAASKGLKLLQFSSEPMIHSIGETQKTSLGKTFFCTSPFGATT
jgi:rhamnosyltransferase